jgi:hypothetical protein
MSKTVLVLFAACVGLSLLSLHLVKQMRAGQATIAELQARIANLETQPRQNPPLAAKVVQVSPPAQPEAVTATPSKEVVMGMSVKRTRPSASQAEPVADASSRDEGIRMMQAARERERQLMQDPEYREAVRVQQRSNINRQYPGLGQELGLTVEQTDQLFDLLVDQQMRNHEKAVLNWDSEGLDPAAMLQRQEKVQQQWMEMQRRNEAELTAQLGTAKMKAWQDYQATLPARYQVEQLRTTMASRGVPLSEEASRAAVKAFAEAQKIEAQEHAYLAGANIASGKVAAIQMVGRIEPTPEMYERQLEHAKKRNKRVLDAVSPFLTYEQREALQKEQDAELKMQEAQMRIMRAQSTAGDNNASDWVGSPAQGIVVPDR